MRPLVALELALVTVVAVVWPADDGPRRRRRPEDSDSEECEDSAANDLAGPLLAATELPGP